VEVESYNIEIEDDDAFVGYKASNRAFREILERMRIGPRKSDEDPLGDKDSEDFNKKKLKALLIKGKPESAAIVQGAIEDLAKDLSKARVRDTKL
jgi:hypothetical protein